MEIIIKIEDKKLTIIPTEQLELIQKALSFYIKTSEQFNMCPTDSEHYELFDMKQLREMMNYPISIDISDDDKDSFASKHGIDFPLY
jgi:hypothetical protein